VWASLTANKSSQGLSFGITTDGVAYAWGGDQNGAQGTGSSFVSKSSPVTVAGGLTWSQIAAYPFGGVGITTDGVAYGWGQNTSGIIGCGDANARNSPVSVVGGLTFSQLSVGYAHTVAITSSGVAWSWGRNSQGQLGIGSSSYGTSRLSPVSVVGGLTFTQVTAGYNFCCGIANTGVAYSWGYQTSGRLGDGGSGYTAVVSPKSVVGGLTWSQVSAGTQHCLGLRTNGVAYGWGTNTKAELGDGTLSNRSSPVSVLGGITNWSQLSAGKEHSLGATSAGILYAWGNNDNGQMGTGNLTSSRSPVTVIGGLSGWVKLSAGGGHNLAILTVESGIE
jgi:alpha-tubulin suppressor-like RCC1 family protein